MARETRRIGIRTAEVRLPGPVSAGPALLKVAGTIANREFEKAADIRNQEAIRDAAALNFERDGDGNLVAPAVPISEEGLLAPSIYDRQYTQMVGQRYLQQMQIDVSENINKIHADNPFEPETFRTLAEGYVSKVTELAPDYLKADVNNSAQVKMVEHFNQIIRVRAERDHEEARGLQLQTIESDMDEVVGYVAGGADPEVIGGAMLKARAAIEQGDELNFWLDDEKAEMLDAIDRQFAIANISNMITSLPPGDFVAASELNQALNNFAMGEGTFPMVDELGNVAHVPLDDMPISPLERIAIADHATKLVNAQFTAFENVLDNRLKKDKRTFYDWWSPHALDSLTPGKEVDIDRLYREFDKAHTNVIQSGYDDSLREEIRALITDTIGSSTRQMSQEQQSFNDDWNAWRRMIDAETTKRLAGRDPQSLTTSEALTLRHNVLKDTGGLSSGNQQTAANSRFISEYYSAMAGRDLTGPVGRDFWNDILQNPTSEKWEEVEWLAKYQFSPIGIWPQELSAAIIGKMNDPEGMNQQSLDDTMRLTRAFWDNPTFQANMTDSNALGTQVGRTLDHLFRLGGQPTPETAQNFLERFNDPNWTPRAVFNDLESDDQEQFKVAAGNAIDRYFNANWKTAWIPTGLQTGTFGFNPFDVDLAGVPLDVKHDVMRQVISNAGFIDPDDTSSFNAFIAQSARTAMQNNGYAPSAMGYSPFRHNDQFNFEWTRPDAAIVAFPPEFFARTDDQGNISEFGSINQELMGMIGENFQVILDHYGRQRDQKWTAGVNAALRYNGDASVKFGSPHWDIMLIREGGLDPSVLTETGIFNGTNVLFNMNEAIIRFNKVQDERRRERNARTERQRLDYQSGTYVNGRWYPRPRPPEE